MPVNVYTEWGPLKEVIVGNSMNYNMEGFDEVFKLLYRDNIDRALAKDKDGKKYKIHRQYTIERQEDLDKFANTLSDLGIKVRRPKRLDRMIVTRTPYFKALINAVDQPRDMFLCLGNEIIETSPTNRNRYFEGLMMRHIFMDYFREGARWNLAPRTRLLGDSVDTVRWTEVNKLHKLDEIEECFDIAFDAANCLKFGRDILMNVGNKNHELGSMWLQRHLSEDFRVHLVRVCDMHIDGMLMPLRKGVLLVNSDMKKKMQLLPKPLQRWKIIEVPSQQKQFNYPDDHLQLASFNGMSTNVFSIDENSVCVRKQDIAIQHVLEKAGFDIIKVPMRHAELFGGGLHCVTLDVNREEGLEDNWSK